MIFAEVAIGFDEKVLRSLAWIFTALSGIISIILSVHRFGLPTRQRLAAIGGVITVGIVLALMLIFDVFPFNRFVFISKQQTEQIKTAHKKEGNTSSGYTVTEDGVDEDAAEVEVNRMSEYIYAVIHPNGKITAVYNGGFFDAEVNGRTINCELIDIGDNRVLVIMGDQLETIELTSNQEGNTFRIQKVPVKKPEAG